MLFKLDFNYFFAGKKSSRQLNWNFLLFVRTCQCFSTIFQRSLPFCFPYSKIMQEQKSIHYLPFSPLHNLAHFSQFLIYFMLSKCYNVVQIFQEKTIIYTVNIITKWVKIAQSFSKHTIRLWENAYGQKTKMH